MTDPFSPIDADAGEPPFEQLRAQLIDAVRSGRATAGDKLPTVRGLASDLGLAANTVAKAYRALETDGLIETRGRSGSFVSAQGDATQQRLQRAASDYARLAHEMKVDAASALDYVTAALGIRP
ncbi:GntR family transcriptional regulator [Paramicrobacterium agarici]|uniref:DNA-binding transcriptional regulator YhcF (GntR family) n=1 Tax=Paramicrobacterium agarici TaxID=630514 RepID=A0A2A9DS12_9MICO|nr:GntR family transcriptional regulator [Microbacterium agarici]PFG29364.1 DNA-binding transcriptional regulator YhcF (GntR family) [Microbacterium agarici]TQO22372.1 DNA-binding transcriptional regulator YhcF (GntR family) [Microbacterium agarici]